MDESQCYAKLQVLSKRFLFKTYAHPLLTDIPGVKPDDDFYIKMWESTPDPEESHFKGIHGGQFESIEALTSFSNAFKSILVKHKIDKKHEDELLYFINFYDKDSQTQNKTNYEYNKLLEYTKFILDLHQTTESHIDSYEKNKEYRKVWHEGMKAFYFAKHSLFEQYTEEQISDIMPMKNPDDIITFLRISVGATEFYIPRELRLSISSSIGTKNFDGEALANGLAFPASIQYEMLRYTLDYMIDAHKRNNTQFYHEISTSPLSREAFNSLYNKYRKSSFKSNSAILKIGTVISDYLVEYKLIITKRAIAAFLFDYFALFKVFRVKTEEALPNDYSELSAFYIKHNINEESVRMIMREGL